MTGTITIKMMSITSSTSISGVTLISEDRPSPPEGRIVENAIAIVSQFRNWASERSIDSATTKLRKALGGQPIGHTARTRASTYLLPCFNPWRDQTDIVNPSLMAKVDNLGDLAEVEILIALDEHNLLLTSGEDLRQLRLDRRLAKVSELIMYEGAAAPFDWIDTTIVRSFCWSSLWSLGG